MTYQGKRIVVLGLGRSGLAAAQLLRQKGALVTVCDSGKSTFPPLAERIALLRSEGITVLTGNAADQDPSRYDLAILSPGIEETTSLVTNVMSKGTPLIGELELASSLAQCPVVAITGTNGKTTTTELTALALKGAGLRTMACGNIGLPFSEVVLGTTTQATSEAADLDVIVVEVSSFQLERTPSFHPHVAVWLNLSPNHLDRYSGMEEYRAAKLRIFSHQTGDDFAVIPLPSPENNLPPLPSLRARCLTFSASMPGGDLSLEGSMICCQGKPILDFRKTRLRGLHNAENLMAALAVGVALNSDLHRMAAAVSGYTPPPHRCEFVMEHRGVQWINDSKATTLDAMEQALRAVDHDRPLLLIAGGKDKGFGFLPIAPLVKDRVKGVILLGEMRQRIADDWKGVPCQLASSLEEAVTMAATAAHAGDTVLFSPGTSSFDMFHDYVERGDRFKKLVSTVNQEAASPDFRKGLYPFFNDPSPSSTQQRQ